MKEGDFLESLESWEVLTRRYEIQAKEHVSDSTKIAVLMKHVFEIGLEDCRSSGWNEL